MTVWTDDDHPENMTPEEIAEREAADKLSFYKLLARVFSTDAAQPSDDTAEEAAEPEASEPAIIPCNYPQGSPVVIIPEFGEPVTGADTWHRIIIEDSEPDDGAQEILLDRHGEGPDRYLGIYNAHYIGRIFEELRLLVNDSNAAAIIMPETDAGHVDSRPLHWG